MYVLYRILITPYTLPVVYLLLSYILYDNIDCCEQGRKPALAIFILFILVLITFVLITVSFSGLWVVSYTGLPIVSFSGLPL